MGVELFLGAVELTQDQLNTFLGLVFSPFVAIGSLTTFIVGMNAFIALAVSAGLGDVPARIDQAMAYGTARAFVVSLPPAAFLLFTTLKVYT
jgi:hypothetical protein